MLTATQSGVDAPRLRPTREALRFEAGKTLGHVERLSYPRRTGTPGERRAARYILREFSALGLVRRREAFPVPYLAQEVGTRLVFAAAAAAVGLGAWTSTTWPVAAAALWAAAGVLLNSPWKIARGCGSRWPSAVTSENLSATLVDDGAADAPARVVFMAHYDTKSQPLPTGVRVGLVVAATILCGLLVALGLLATAGYPRATGGYATAVPAALVVAILAALAANLIGNRSPGALDNATGVGAMLELARTWRPRSGRPVEVLWVATGSEEVGLDGARHFVDRHEAWWREKPTLLINLDSVGAGGRIYLAGDPGSVRLAGDAADSLGLPWSRLRVLGAGMDHEPFADRGLAAVSLLGDVVGYSLQLHSRRDLPPLADGDALGRAGRLAAQVAWDWADRHTVGDAAPVAVTPRTRRRG